MINAGLNYLSAPELQRFSLEQQGRGLYHAASTTNWDAIDRATDTQQPFDLFHNHLTELFKNTFQKSR